MFPTMSIGKIQIAQGYVSLDNSNMEHTLKEIVEARLSELGTNPFAAAKKGGLERSYINDLLIGKKQSVKSSMIPRLALALDMTASELNYLLSPFMSKDLPTVAVMGRIGAGAEILPELEQTPPEGLYDIQTLIPVPAGSIAFEVEGDSMWPRYDPGDVIVCLQEGTNLPDVIGHEAAVLTSDGKRYLKRVLQGAADGTFDLESHNAGTIRGVTIDWVAGIELVIRSSRWKKLSNGEQNRLLKKKLGS